MAAIRKSGTSVGVGRIGSSSGDGVFSTFRLPDGRTMRIMSSDVHEVGVKRAGKFLSGVIQRNAERRDK